MLTIRRKARIAVLLRSARQTHRIGRRFVWVLCTSQPIGDGRVHAHTLAVEHDAEDLRYTNVLTAVQTQARKRRTITALSLLLLAQTLGCGSADSNDPAPSRTTHHALTLDDPAYVVTEGAADRFPLATAGRPVPLVVETGSYPGVLRVAGHLRADIERVVGVAPELMTGTLPSSGPCVVIGTLGNSPLIDQLVAAGKVDVTTIRDQWEATLIQTVEAPWPDVPKALVIVGSDKRGTIYGMFDLSAKIGVSPWYYWADVPVRRQQELHVLAGVRRLGSPAVKYRGIFINDENPALSGWASSQFGGFNSKFYDKLFELMLRLRANYLWPAMWGKAFNVDDPKSPELADEYGIVMGTSHHEPLMRNQKEWTKGSAAWNFSTNQAALEEFWAGGIQRMGTRESIVTIGMRGDGDEAMSPNPDPALLQTIIAAQRSIIGRVTGRDPASVPQVWTLYKEVQDYWDQGLRAPDDVTVVLADDNFGNIRKLPVLSEPIHTGGFGIYYHFDYVGSPRNYKWLNTNLVPRIWEQMHLAYEHKVDRLWLVNVGDLKLLEYPTQFFLDYAWDPKAMTAERLSDYSRQFAAQQFGEQYAAAIADILTKYSKFNARRKPELLSPSTYSLVNFREADRIVAEYNGLAQQAEAIAQALPAEYADAYHQLVLFPVKASANLNDLYVTAGRNRLYFDQGRAATNDLAKRAEQLFARDAELTRYFNRTLANGKWNHIADQTHIGYTSWQEPSKNNMPEVKRLTLADTAEMGVAVEGSDKFLPSDGVTLKLPESSPYQLQPARYLDVYRRGTQPFDYRVETGVDYVSATPAAGPVGTETRIWLSVDFARAPSGKSEIPITVFGPSGASLVVQFPIDNPVSKPAATTLLVERNGHVAMEAEQYSRKVDADPIRWQLIPDLSRTTSGITPFPVTSPPQTPGVASPRLEYDLHLWASGSVKVHVQVAPTAQYVRTGLKYAVSFDEQNPQAFNIHGDPTDGTWQERVSNNANTSTTYHKLEGAGAHVLKLWMIDPGIVFQKIVVETASVPASYLGPPTATFQEPALEIAPLADPITEPASGGAPGAAGAAGAVNTPSTTSLPSRGKPSSGDSVEGGACNLTFATKSQRSELWIVATLLVLGVARYRRRIRS